MALQLDFLLPPPPKDWDSNHDVKVHKRISPVKSGSVEPVGAEFLAVLRRNRYNRSLTQDWELEAALQGANDGGDDDDLEDEPETKELLASNQEKWKVKIVPGRDCHRVSLRRTGWVFIRITTPFFVLLSSAGALPMTKSSAPRFSYTSPHSTATVSDRNALRTAAAEAAQKKEAAEVKEKPSDRSKVNSDLAVPAPSSVKSTKAAPAGGVTAGGFVLPENDTWSAAQQTQLEEGLKKFPTSQLSASPAKRWETIANEVEGRSVKEVKQRMKYLQDAVSKKPAKK
ncbi:hypothetical protein BC830DRAFT_1138876 [Chytriomyces sp. MP71]|nr:hypothetical protein BC830DRAFT_1138876 [Chytriomyces sp. MP71]